MKKKRQKKQCSKATCQTKKNPGKKILSQARSTRRPSSPLMSDGGRWVV
jgi:hypothetical protein